MIKKPANEVSVIEKFLFLFISISTVILVLISFSLIIN